MNFTQSMSIAKKLAVLNAGAILGIIILTAIFLISERTLILEERTSNVRQAVETAYGVLDYYQKQEASGTCRARKRRRRRWTRSRCCDMATTNISG